MESSYLNELIQQITCPICYEEYSTSDSRPLQRPKVLHCSHSLCTQCLMKLEEGSGMIRCPSCKEITYGTVDQLPFNRSFEGLIDTIACMQRSINNDQQGSSSAPERKDKEKIDSDEDEESTAGNIGNNSSIRYVTPLCFECEEHNRVTPATHSCPQCSGALFCEQCYFNIHQQEFSLQHHRIPLDREMKQSNNSNSRTPLLLGRKSSKLKSRYKWRKKYYSCCKSLRAFPLFTLLFKTLLFVIFLLISAFLCTVAIFSSRAIISRIFDVDVQQLLVWSFQLFPASKWLSTHSLSHPIECGQLMYEKVWDFDNLTPHKKAWIYFTGSITPLSVSFLTVLCFSMRKPRWFISKLIYVVLTLWCLDSLLRMLPVLHISILIVYGQRDADVFSSPLYFSLLTLGVGSWWIALSILWVDSFILHVLSLRIWNLMIIQNSPIVIKIEQLLINLRFVDLYLNKGIEARGRVHGPTPFEKQKRMKRVLFLLHLTTFAAWCLIIFMVVAWSDLPKCDTSNSVTPHTCFTDGSHYEW